MKKYMLSKDYNFKIEKSDFNISAFGFPDHLYRTMTMNDYNNLEKDFYNLKTDFYLKD